MKKDVNILWYVAAMVLSLVVSAGLAFGAEHQAIATQTRAVLERNFQACNNEDITALMDTQARSLPKADMDEFRAEAEKMFADTDVYMRLAEFQLLKVQLPFAAARVVQVTLPGDEADRQNPEAARRFYRSHTMLLPEYERVEYIQTFKREGGKWRLWEIVTRPKPVDVPGARQATPAAPNCQNGQCRKQSTTGSIFR